MNNCFSLLLLIACFFFTLQGPCCTDECQLRYGVKCRDDNGCRDAAFCDGSGPRCPPSNNKPNKTVCNEEFVCFMGVRTMDQHARLTHLLNIECSGMHGIDMHRVRPPVVPVSPGPRGPAHEGVRTLLQAARRRPAVPVS